MDVDLLRAASPAGLYVLVMVLTDMTKTAAFLDKSGDLRDRWAPWIAVAWGVALGCFSTAITGQELNRAAAVGFLVGLAATKSYAKLAPLVRKSADPA